MLTYWRLFGYISNESGKWTEAQETIYEVSKEVTKEENILNGGPYLVFDNSRWNILRLKNRDGFFFDLKASGLKPIMIEKVRSVSCIVAKCLSFINHCLNVLKKLEVMVQNQNRWVKFSNSTSQKVHLLLFLIPIFFRKSFVASRLCSSLNWKVITLVILVQMKGSR